MRQTFVRLAALCAAAVLPLMVLRAAPATAADPPVFREVSCDGLVFPSETIDVSRFRCGTVTVPENRHQPSEGTIDIYAAVMKAPAPDVKPDPVMFLPGGPGQSSVDFAAFAAEWYTQSIDDRDFVVFDFRGTGYSNKLACPEADSQFADSVLAGEDYVPPEIDPLEACRQRYIADGVDLSQYNSARIAEDMVDVMTALGYEQWNLIGGSYGTRLALTAMRDFPQHIRSAVLDAPAPPGINVDIERARYFEQKLNELFAACAADAECGAAYPDITQTFWDLVARANEDPIEVTITAPDGRTVDIEVNGYGLINGVQQAMQDDTTIPLVPFAIDDIARGNTGVLATVASQQLFVDYGIATGMFYAVQCYEEWPFYTEGAITNIRRGIRPEVLDAIGFNDPAIAGSYTEFCEDWNDGVVSPKESKQVTSSIPAMILSGEFDTNTVTEFGDRAASTLSNGFVIEVPASGHFVSFERRACVDPLIAEFIDAPEQRPDDSCVRAIPPPDFVVFSDEPEVSEPEPAPDTAPPPPSGVISGPDTGMGPGAGTSAATTQLTVALLLIGSMLMAVGLRARMHSS